MFDLARLRREADLFALLADPANQSCPRELLTAALTVAKDRTLAHKAYLAVYAPGASAPLTPLWDVALGCDTTDAEAYRAHFSRTILQRALTPERGARALHVHDAMRLFPADHSVSQKKIASVVAAPFGGIARGVLVVQWRRAVGERFSDEDRAFIERLGRTLGPVVDGLARDLVGDVDATMWWRGDGRFSEVVGRCEAFAALLGEAHRLMGMAGAVAVVGPRGSGRTTIARTLHEAERAGRPFVTVDAAADLSSPALVAASAGGTLFVTGLSGDAAVASARERALAVPADRVRVVLEVEASPGVTPALPGLHVLRIPALAERRGDLVPLLNHFGERAALSRGLPWRGLDEAVQHAFDVLVEGREVADLEEAIELAMSLDPTRALDVPRLLPRPQQVSANPTHDNVRSFVLGPLKESVLPEFERTYLVWALARCGWNPDITAVRLEISRATMWEKVKRYEIVLPPRSERSRAS